jgi:tetratricopeptide (TPR) repeat protein
MEAAQTATDKLIADFNGEPDLDEALSRIAGRYYRKASFLLMGSNNEPNEQSGSCLQRAAEMYEILTEQFPVSSSTAERYRLLGDCERKLGEYEKAVEHYRKVVSDYSGYQLADHAWFFIGRCLEALRESGAMPEEEANQQIEQAYEVIVEEYPDYKRFGYACGELGWLNFGKGRWDKAVEYFEPALRKYPENYRPGSVLYALGRAYEEIGLSDKAKQVYEEFIKTVPVGDPRVETVEARIEKLGENS